MLQSITRDSRHRRFIKLMNAKIEARSFGIGRWGPWPKYPGYNDFFDSGRCLPDVDAGRAKIILEMFI